MIKYSKIFDESSGNNYTFAKKIDNQLQGQDQDLKINIITPLFESDYNIRIYSRKRGGKGLREVLEKFLYDHFA